MIPLKLRRALLLATIMALLCLGLAAVWFDPSGTLAARTGFLLITPLPGFALGLVLVSSLDCATGIWRKLGLVLLGGALYWPIGFCAAWAVATPGNHPDISVFFEVLIPTVAVGSLSWLGAVLYLLLSRWMIQLPIEWKGVPSAGLWCVPAFAPLFMVGLPKVPPLITQMSLFLGMVFWWWLFLFAVSRKVSPLRDPTVGTVSNA